MLNQILAFVGVVCCVAGVFNLFTRSSRSDEGTITAAAVLSVGLVLTYSSLRTWLKWRKYTKINFEDLGDPTINHTLPQAGRSPVLTKGDPRERRRSTRLLLQTMVVVRMDSLGGQCLEIQGFTAWVNAHGGVLECPMRIPLGEEITLVNPQSRKKVRCRVLQVQRESEGSFAISVEFDLPSTSFWQVLFLPVDWGFVERVRK